MEKIVDKKSFESSNTDFRYSNNFDILRFIAAVLVIFSHSFAILSKSDPLSSYTGHYGFGAFGVYIFFVISGYLIPDSALRSKTLVNYFRKRTLRIVPGLAFVTIIITFLLGPLSTDYSLFAYLTDPRTWYYLTTIRLYHIPYELPGVFTNSPHSRIINAPLWTLSSEFTCYILVAILAYFKVLKKYNSSLLIYFSLLLFVLTQNVRDPIFESYPSSDLLYFPIRFLGGESTIIFALYFTSGMILNEYKDYLYSNSSLIFFFILVYALSIKFTIKTGSGKDFPIFTLLTIPYIIIFLSRLKFRITNTFGKYGDFSYGMYIIGWPIQQLYVIHFPNISPIELFIASFITILPMAYYSWHKIEKVALKFKNEV